MKTTSTSEIEAKGVDQRYRAAPNAASNVEGHFHPDPNGGGWINDRGIEPLIPLDATITIPTIDIPKRLQPVRFLSVVSRHQGAECYYLYEQNGDLKYDMGNKGTYVGQSIRQTSVLSSGRKIPKPDDCGTQITTYGRFNLIVNGYDKMLKWWGREAYSDFGFLSATPVPTLAGVDTKYIIYRDGKIPEQKIEFLESGDVCVRFGKIAYQGLGTTTKGDINRYDYKISFVTDTGSESPLSDSATISWTISSESFTGDPTADYKPSQVDYAEGKYGVFLTDLPIGPKGTVARRIYRTKNRKDGLTGSGEIYYLVTQVNNNSDSQFLDVVPDQDLITLAPSVDDSTIISSQWKYCATWNNSIWLAGGEQNPYGIIYSKTGLPEQFGLTDYFDVGLREGGAITALVPFYDVLLVFRERSIELITVGSSGYVISTLDANIGTTATNTIKLVAGYGVMFLSKDGVFAITGSVRGGAVYRVVKMSEQIEREMGRISISALPRATATYSEREKEYWVHYPIDGETENSRGAVFHTMNEEWTFRWGDGFYSNGNGMPFTCLATDPNGWIIIGTKPFIGPDLLGRRGAPAIGLQVWSASRWAGQYLSNPVVNQGNTTFNINYIPKEKDVWESVWTDFGDDSKKKRVISVELEIITTGNNPITLEWATDWGYTFTSSGTQIPLRPETVGTASSEPIYASVPTGTEPNSAVWGQSVWSQTQVTRIRWDIGTSLCSQFKFRLTSSNLIQVISYQIEAVGSQNKTLNQNGATSRQ